MVTDPLSDILSLVNAQSMMTGGFYAGSDWALRFRPPKEIKLYAIMKGSCWLSVEGQPIPLHLQTGDVVVLSAKRPLLFASDLNIEAQDAHLVFADAVNGFVTLGEGNEFLMLGGHVSLDPARGSLLLDVLAPLIRVCGSSPEATAVQQLLTQLVEEVHQDRAGTRLASMMLTQLVFLQVLRAHLAASAPFSKGWLRALGDEAIAPALRLMHSDPGRSWQLPELAKAVGMSRTTFALRFKTVVGIAPLTYLLNWRMRLAERALQEQSTSVSILAHSLGYTSESAFSNAFKRVTGLAPKRYQATFATTDSTA